MPPEARVHVAGAGTFTGGSVQTIGTIAQNQWAETPPQMLIQIGFAPDEVKVVKIKRTLGAT